jgi:hypothetical protein
MSEISTLVGRGLSNRIQRLSEGAQSPYIAVRESTKYTKGDYVFCSDRMVATMTADKHLVGKLEGDYNEHLAVADRTIIKWMLEK